MFLRKSPHSLPPDEYGGGRKRIFIGLMLASCLLVCFLLGLFLVLPWFLPGGVPAWLTGLASAFGCISVAVLLWLCLTLVFHIYTGRLLPGVGGVRHVTIRLFFPLMELLAKLVGMDRNKVRRSFIKVNNELVLAAIKPERPNRPGRPVRPESLLLLLPHCVQNSLCTHRLNHRVSACTRCGKCQVAALLELRDRYGIGFAIATGGTVARRIVVEMRPAAIIAVACERDLTSGIQDSYPLPVFGVLNERPHGPCLDTLVPLERLEAVIRLFLSGQDDASRNRAGL